MEWVLSRIEVAELATCSRRSAGSRTSGVWCRDVTVLPSPVRQRARALAVMSQGLARRPP